MRGLVLGILLVPQSVALVATAFPWAHGLGAPTWHHNASLAGSLLAFAWVCTLRGPQGRLATDRAHLGVGVLVWTTLAIVSGFLLLYLKQDLKGWDLKDWAKWWHITWSWLALWYFLLHTWVNRRPMMVALGRWTRGAYALMMYGVLGLIVIAVPLTWSAWGAGAIVDGNYIVLTLWTWVLLTGPPYGLWLAVRADPPRWAERRSMVAGIDVWLLPATLLANLSGLPLLYFDTKSTALKYVAKYWHTWPSIAMTLLVFVHSVQWWPSVRSHWRGHRTA